MELGLKGKVALVTGRGSQIGFGKGIALALAGEGCDIVVGNRDLLRTLPVVRPEHAVYYIADNRIFTGKWYDNLKAQSSRKERGRTYGRE